MIFFWVVVIPFCSPALIAQESVDKSNDRFTKEVLQLREELAHVSERLTALKEADPDPPLPTISAQASPTEFTALPKYPELKPADAATPSYSHDTTINFGIDDCYGYNFNQPIGQVDLLRVYDVTNNSFDISQANIIEYFDDRSALFSGTNQALKEFTFATDRQVAPGFLVSRAGYRRDFSNHLLFFTDTPDVLSHSQTTATLGLMDRWGSKQVSW